ncbi:insulinase family protein [Pedobacter sp. BS3]|uniref:M16 family metallopeptidase n=1 Tax=Pedobacter sp. BS3 TaxID=2567937 RepID=UPI0011EC266E|nr:pitrilysin family protein [Pedobacter sp. BS3]TZF81201.1 insulinase family protein [Pedobacter sp. BS3]
MIDRTIAPAFRQIEKVDLIQAVPLKLDNGIPVYSIYSGEQDLIRLEFIFDNVNWDASRPLQASVANGMLNEGTATLNAAQIAEKIDYYGAFLQTEYTYDHSSLVLYTLNKYLDNVLPVVHDVLTHSVFPVDELEVYRLNHQQQIKVQLEKNDFVARQTLGHALFGSSIYGHPVTVTDYQELQREDVCSYFSTAYQPQNCIIVASGKVNDHVIAQLNSYFGEWKSQASYHKNTFGFTAGQGQEHYIEKPEALQSAIRMGILAINRSHPDFAGLQVLNTVLGGYFGSRLMANIREDKGYTYGIGSALVSLQHAGYLFIASEVGAEVCGAAMEEIRKEVRLLRDELILPDELALVRNYMLGSFLGSLENAFSHADKFKNIYFSGLGYDYFEHYVNTVKTITPQRLQELANQYLDFDRFEKVIVGRR